MAFELNDERAINVLMWWIEGADGSIDYDEEQAVQRVLKEMDYSPETFYEETRLHISGLGMDDVHKLVEESIEWVAEHFDEAHKKLTHSLLETIAASNGKITDEQQEKLDRLEDEFE